MCPPRARSCSRATRSSGAHGWWVDIYYARGSEDGGGDWAVVERKGGGGGTTARRRHGRAAGAWIAVDGRKKGSKGRKGRGGEK
jgi:hypothetical protein